MFRRKLVGVLVARNFLVKRPNTIAAGDALAFRDGKALRRGGGMDNLTPRVKSQPTLPPPPSPLPSPGRFFALFILPFGVFPRFRATASPIFLPVACRERQKCLPLTSLRRKVQFPVLNVPKCRLGCCWDRTLVPRLFKREPPCVSRPMNLGSL